MGKIKRVETLDELSELAGDDIIRVMKDLIKPENWDFILEWYYTPNQLCGKTPYEYVKEGKGMKLYEHLEALANGDYPM